TPYEIVTDTRPDLRYLCVFGCGAYVFLTPEQRDNKLAPCSKPMIFLGYEGSGYKFMRHLKGNVIFRSPTAIFQEDWFPK
ncbi:hypothetical protein P691DRAFT_621448, partial [Macrolepiota fuliginosa MF-IS2]